MPFVRIYLRKGKSAEALQAVGDAVHESLVAQANVPVDDRFQVFVQLEPECLSANSSYGDVSRSEGLIIVEIILNSGRTVEIKKNLYADIVRRLGGACDVRPDDVLISLVEVTKENWSFGKGIATYA